MNTQQQQRQLLGADGRLEDGIHDAAVNWKVL